MDYEWGVTFTGQSLLPIVVPYRGCLFMIRERFTSSLKTCWRLPNFLVSNRIRQFPLPKSANHIHTCFNVGALRTTPTIWRLQWEDS